ncbi:NUDIX hydrolase [Clostridium sp. AL.422]|uniref:NUDIX hydrolase n=1 Tax=Clostridium TaxID=1485 RepID=UPI00293DB394|nr:MULTISPECIES: NUDIX hydrolase [unclassified Clostridium]MDV4151927.1 NUDIX hydrolase [Clostridium sp. AL.422]
MEIWDAYYKDGTKANHDLIRGEAIPKGFYHLVCEVLVKHVDGTYLLMQRDFNKETFPGKYEASAGGSSLKGEAPIQCAIRELNEETGITATSLDEIYYVVSEENERIYHGYLCVVDCDKDSIILQEGETISYKWMKEEDFLDFVNSNEYSGGHRKRLKVYFDKIK